MIPKVSIEGLSFTYRGADKPALDNITAEVRSGEYVVIMGAGGSGKSSLCYSLNGVIPHLLKGSYVGRVVANDYEIAKHKVAQIAQSVGLTLQDFESQLFSSTVELEMAFGLENLCLDRPEIASRISKYLSLIGLENRRQFPPAILSDGQKQLLAIGSVLALAPEVLVMDEPTTDLGPVARQRVLNLASKVRQEGATIIVTDHRPETALEADTIWLLKNGLLVKSGTPQEVMVDTPLLSECAIRPPALVELLDAAGCSPKLCSVEEATRILQERQQELCRLKTTSRNGRLRNVINSPASRKQPAPFSALGPLTLKTSSESGSHAVRSFSTQSPILETANLTHTYKPLTVAAIQNIDLQISDGEFVAIIGPNGSGKTTLAKHFNRLLEATLGQVFVDGRLIQAYRRHDLAQIVGYVFQNPDHQIFAPTVAEEVGFSLQQFGFDQNSIDRRVVEALAGVGLQGYEQADPAQLTKGERQRVAVASALVARPRVLILDEPTKGLDYPRQQNLKRMLVDLNQQGHTIILITHSLWLVAEQATRVIVLNGGKVVLDGPSRSVFAQEDVLAESGLQPPALVRLSNRLGLQALTVQQIVWEMGLT